MLEIDEKVERIGWKRFGTYGIMEAGGSGCYVGCSWRAENATIKGAQVELAESGILPSECVVCSQEDFSAIQENHCADANFGDVEIQQDPVVTASRTNKTGGGRSPPRRDR
jgi:hypothetical protein